MILIENTLARLGADLRAMGVAKGDTLMVHASLKSIGPIPGGAEALLRLFFEELGAEGTLAMPVFTYSFVGCDKSPPFDSVRSVSQTGALTEVFRKMPGTVRSFHPTHSVAVWGRSAAECIHGHSATTAFGMQSPFHKLACQEAKVLLIGCGFTSLSLIHVGESVSRVYYRDRFCWRHRGWEPKARVALPDGGTQIVAQHEAPGCSASFSRLEPLAHRAGIVAKFPLGAATVTVVSALPLLRLIERTLAKNPDFLLCAPGACPTCNERREERKISPSGRSGQ